MLKKQPDVLIIGGGVIGLACAHYLLKEGRRVLILEQDRIGAGASYGNCGFIFTSDLPPLCTPGVIRQETIRLLRKTSPLYVKLSFNPSLFAWLLKFALSCNTAHLHNAMAAREKIMSHSKQLYHHLLREEEIDCDWESKGILMVYKNEKALMQYQKINELLKPYKMAAMRLTRSEVLDKEPALREDVCGGWYHAIDSHLRPDRLLSGWQKVLTRNGVDILEECPVNEILRRRHAVIGAATNRGNIYADTVVLAAGAWSPRLSFQLGFKLPLQPGKGYSITMAKPSRSLRIPCYFSERSVAATPWKSGYRLGGTMEFSGYNTTLIRSRIEGIKAAARDYLKEPFGSPVQEEWVGMRPMCHDDLPVIGRVPGIRNLILAVGHGMTGLSMATGTGRLVADIIVGKAPHIDPRPFRLARFQ
jgi:D-amino-acid dehydrogenase